MTLKALNRFSKVTLVARMGSVPAGAVAPRRPLTRPSGGAGSPLALPSLPPPASPGCWAAHTDVYSSVWSWTSEVRELGGATPHPVCETWVRALPWGF